MNFREIARGYKLSEHEKPAGNVEEMVGESASTSVALKMVLGGICII